MLKRTKGYTLLLLLVLTGLAGRLFTTTITSQERRFLLDELKESKAGVQNAIKGLTEEQLNFKTSPEKWSVKECLQHIAIKNDIAIYAAHTNLDNVVLGVNGKIAQMIGLKEQTILQPKPKILRRLITFAPVDQAEQVRQAVFNAGAGHIGKYSECSFNSEGTGTFKAGPGADPYVGEVGKRQYERETKIEIVYPAYLELQVVKALLDNHPYEEVAYDIFTMENVHYGIGSGIIGELDQPITEQAFLGKLKKI